MCHDVFQETCDGEVGFCIAITYYIVTYYKVFQLILI